MLADERCTRRDERALTAQCTSQHLGGRAGRVETRSAEVDVASQRFGERREMGLHDVPDDIDFDTEVPVDEDVAQAPDAAGDVPMRVCDLCREVLHGFADDLQVAPDRVLSHLHHAHISFKRGEISLASFDGLENIGDAVRRVSAHSATASMSAEAEIGRLSSWTGKERQQALSREASCPPRCFSNVEPELRTAFRHLSPSQRIGAHWLVGSF